MSTDYARSQTPVSPPVRPWDVLAPIEPTPIRPAPHTSEVGAPDLLLRRLVEHSPDALFYYEVRPAPRFRYLSPAIQGVTGHPPEAFLRDADLGVTIVHEDDRHRVARALRSGADAPVRVRILHASGHIHPVEYHSAAVRNASGDVVAVCGSIHDDFVLQLPPRAGNAYGLTSRELTVLDLVAAGRADKQIAEVLGISTYTVNKHVGNILSKMQAASRTEAGVRAIREDLIA